MQSFLFTGQGAQTPGMMKGLYDAHETVRAVFWTADQVLGRSISSLCFFGSQEELNLTHNTQPCMLAADLAAYAVASEHGIMPDAVAGFSLGEYAALVAADVLSAEDAFRIIQIRADAMQKAVSVNHGSMAAVMKVSSVEVEDLCNAVDGYVVIANYNSPVQTVVTGETDAVNQLLELTRQRKIRTVKLPVSAPFHCRLMEPAKKRLEGVFHDTVFHDASIPVYMNIDGKAHIQAEDIKDCVLRQTVSPVMWTDTLINMQQVGIGTLIELGAGKTLSGFVDKTLSNVTVASITDEDSLNNTICMLGENEWIH